MRIRMWMCGNTMMDRIKNIKFREKLRVAPKFVKMCENRLRWFGQVQRNTFDAPVRRNKNIIMDGKRSQGRH